MKPALLLWLLISVVFPAFSQAIASNVYSWNDAPVVKQSGYEERTLLTGTTRVFSSLSVQAITLLAHHPTQPDQQLDEEAIVLIREGTASVTLGRKVKTLGPGSVVLIMPGDLYRLENKTTQPLTYYLMRYTSSEVPDLDLYRLAGGSFWIDPNEVPYQSDDKGGNRRMFDGGTIMSRRLQMRMTTLKPGLEPHSSTTRQAAQLLILLDNTAQVTIDGVLQPVAVGDLIFLESGVPHSLRNTNRTTPAERSGNCTYFAVQFE